MNYLEIHRDRKVARKVRHHSRKNQRQLRVVARMFRKDPVKAMKQLIALEEDVARARVMYDDLTKLCNKAATG